MRKPLRTVGIAALMIIVAAVASIALPPVLLTDASAPARIAPYVDDARADLRGDVSGFQVPLELTRFAEARCRADGGVMLVFEQWAPPYLSVPYAYVMSGQWPPLSWSGGANWDDLDDDPEIALFFGSSEIPCE